MPYAKTIKGQIDSIIKRIAAGATEEMAALESGFTGDGLRKYKKNNPEDAIRITRAKYKKVYKALNHLYKYGMDTPMTSTKLKALEKWLDIMMKRLPGEEVESTEALEESIDRYIRIRDERKKTEAEDSSRPEATTESNV